LTCQADARTILDNPLIRAMAHLAVSEAMPQGQGEFFD